MSRNSTRLIIDKSSIAGAYLHLPDDEYGEDIKYKGKKFHVPSAETCMERFLFSLNNLLRSFEIRTMDIVLVCDPEVRKSFKTERRKIFPEYKQKERVIPPQYFRERKKFFALVDEWMLDQGAIIATPPRGLEADDLINEFAVRLPKSWIWTRDKDMLACPAAVLYQSKEGIEVNPDKFPVEDRYIHAYRAIVTGDASDNLGSCKGFGPKTWEKMIDIFGEDSIKDIDDMLKEESLFELEKYVVDFPPLQKLIDQAEDIYLSYQVMAFFPVPANKVKWKAGMQKGESLLVTAENFDQILSEIENIRFDYSVIDFETDVPEEAVAWLEQTSDDPKSRVKVDVLASYICGMGLRINNKNWYFSVEHLDTNNITVDQLEEILEILYDKDVYAHNSTGFENVVLYTHYGTFLPGMRDTTIMANYVDENDYTNLKHLSKRDLGYNQATYLATLGNKTGMSQISGQEVFDYGIDDVVVCDALQNFYTLRMMYERSYDVFEEVEVSSAFVTSLSFISGADFDADEHKRLKGINDKAIKDSWLELDKALLEAGADGAEFVPVKGKNFLSFSKVYKAVYGEAFDVTTTVKGAVKFLCGEEIADVFGKQGTQEEINALYKRYWKPAATLNVGSPTQMRDLLYDVLKVPVRITRMPTEKMKAEGRPGNPSSDELAIKNAIAFGDAGQHTKLLEALIKYKGYLTRESLFFSKYPRLVHWKTGKLHCSMTQCGASTRRHTHKTPNLAQMSKKKGKEMRDMVTVPDGDWYLVPFDIDSQELKIQAWASQDANFLSCYTGENKKDVHAMTGYEVARMQGKSAVFSSYEDFASQLGDGQEGKPFRVSGKATNFATAYLCKVRRLANELCVEEEVAQGFIDAKDNAFPGLMPAVNKHNALCRERGYALTFMGARRHLHVNYAKARGSKGATDAVDRLAWSFRIQSSAGEQIRTSMGEMWDQGIFKDGLVQPIVSIHDEFVCRIHGSVLQERIKSIHACMCRQYADMELEQSSTPEYGKHFGSLEEYEIEES